ncbi:hypothetical protein RUM43_004656 [Polyplax serrata]|uniref:C2 domain-containing protein n=1 Tax=Polyplax serrata TaxID=468196 RepID=A0AAN8SB38_POLSC
MDISEGNESENLETPRTMLDDLNVRLEKYLSVLKAAEAEGNGSKVRRYKRIVTQYKDAIARCKSGKSVPLDELPNPPGFEPLVKSTLEVPDSGEFLTPDPSPSMPRKASRSRSRDPSPNPVSQTQDLDLLTDTTEKNLENVGVEEANVAILINDKSLDEVAQDSNTEINILEELKSRLDVYKTVLKSAEDDGNASKARRYKRIIKQYAEAITLHSKGKPVPLEELPSPPGFPPLVPVKSEPPSPIPSRSNSFIRDAHEGGEAPSIDVSAPTDNEPSVSNATSPPAKTRATKSEKQTAILRERQKEYRNAALTAKRDGDIDKAKEYLKICKGFDRLIQASESGLPVDLSTLPVSLKEKKETEDDFEEVSNADVPSDTDNSEIYANLEKELMDQIKMCMNTRNHFKLNGDIANANHFEQFALQFKKDLNYVKVSHSRNNPVPKFHYENKTFSAIQSNTDLTDNELELTIMQGINYKVSNPNDVDTYVTYEFPYPSTSPPSGRTSTIKNTNNPVYNTKLVFPINREASACQRIFKRHGIKLEVWSKGGFFHRDSSLGTVVVKLMPLGKDIIIHEAFDLMNGRRPAGGKLEVKVRIRDPIAGKKVETVSEKWLIIDYN